MQTGRPDPLLNTLFGDYRITERIGEGGFALVYKGTHRYLGNPYALKVLRPERTISQRFIDRFAAEARVTAELKHPNIVRIVDYFHSTVTGIPGDLHCFVMDFIAGPTLGEILRESQRLDLRDILELAVGVGQALEFAHRPSPTRPRGVVHLDIKPENIMFSLSGDPVVMDFGIAAALGAEDARSDVFFGSPTYMSPEQARGEGPIDGRSDIYSLGVVLYEAFAGRPPFVGDPETLRRHHAESMPVRPDVLRRFPGALRRPAAFTAEIIQTCLMKDPEKRYAGCGELLKHLRLLLRDRGLASHTRTLPLIVNRDRP